MPKNSNYTDIMEKNHMEIPWHDYVKNDSNVLIAKAGLIEKSLCYWKGRVNYALRVEQVPGVFVLP